MHSLAPPQIELRTGDVTSVGDAALVAVPFDTKTRHGALAAEAAVLSHRLGIELRQLLDRADPSDRAGEIIEHPVLEESPLERVLLVGVGAGDPASFRRAGAALARAASGRGTLTTSVARAADDAGLAAFIEGLVLGSFRFSRSTEDLPPPPVERVVLAEAGSPRTDVADRAVTVAKAGWLSRELALTPANEKPPQWLAERAAAAAPGLDVEIWDERALARDGFGGILAVGQGSPRPPRLVQLDYRPPARARTARHVVLVGKGITFDTGGLSLKPGEAMMNMKRDMTGAAVVIATMAALRKLDVDVAVTGLLAVAENAISGSAQRPGDVVTHFGGRTSEVTNTDAEGRLVLADALAYAVDRLQPDVLVDVATLTGAVKVALGTSLGGLYSDDDALAGALLAAGDAAGEPLWRLPLVEDYVELLASSVADADNAPLAPGGSITAALFLRPFTGGLPWAHLDIASVGDSPVDAYEWTQGATGFGARALLHWLTGPRPRFAAEAS